MRLKSACLMSTIFSAAVVLPFSGALASGWEDGDCNGFVPCLEYTDGGDWWHIEDPLTHGGTWHGPDNVPFGNFPFGGEVLLNCPIAGISNLRCAVSLEGQFRANVTGSAITGGSVRVLDGSVAQLPPPNDNPQCDNIDMQGFPWYMDSGHNFSNSGGVPLPAPGAPLAGNFGVIDFIVSGFPISGHIHDVTFNNATSIPGFYDPSFFTFDSDIYIRPLGFDVSTGCTLVGNLYSIDGYDINLFH